MRNLFKRLFSPRCGFCGYRIDHFGYESEDLHTIPETEGDPRCNPLVERMMRRVGIRCSKCHAVYCAFCFAYGKRTCARCHRALPYPQGGGVYIDGINHFYGSVENLIAVLCAESSYLWEFLRTYQTEFPTIDKQSALEDLQARLIALVESGKLSIFKPRKDRKKPLRRGDKPLDKQQAVAVLRDGRNWLTQAALTGRNYSVWLKADDTL